MEDSVLPSPAVAEVLNAHYVEARLFTDGDENIDRILALQSQLAGAVTNPLYVLVEPKEEKKLCELQGKRSPKTFKRFLDAGVERAAEKVALVR